MAHNLQETTRDMEEVQTQGSAALLHIGWRRRSLVAVGILVGLALGGLYFAQAAPLYETKAEVLVVKKRPDDITGFDSRHLAVEDYVSTQQMLIQSPLIINQAIRKRQLDTLESFRGQQEDLTEVIKKGLTVSRNKTAGMGNNNILELSYRARKREDCPVVVDAIIESYKDFLDETYKNMSDDTLELVSKAKDDLLKKLQQKNAAYVEFRQKAPLLEKGKDGVILNLSGLISLEAKRSALLARRTDIEGQVAAIEAASKEPGSREALLAMMSQWTDKSDGETVRRSMPPTLQEELLPLLNEEQKLLQDYGPEHPQVQTIHRRIEAVRSLYTDPAAPWRTAVGTGTKAVDPLERSIEYLKQEMNQIRASEKVVSEEFDKEYDKAKKLTSFQVEDDVLKNDISHTNNLVESIVKRLQDVGMVKVAGGYEARVTASPGIGKKVSPKPLLVFPLALLLGIVAGLGLAYLAEITDRSFRNPEEIRRRLGLPVVGYIPLLTTREKALDGVGGALDPMLCTFYRPKSMEAEAYRGVRTSLYFSAGVNGHKLIQVTSPNAGDGKSTLAANLAISVAQSGKRVLLVDADMRKPKIQSMFGLSGREGLSLIITGEAELKDAVQATDMEGLWILPCGPLPPNPAELLTLPRFKELLDLLREQYDCVIIDTPPLLAVTDPCMVAARVDGVLLTIRLAKDSRPAAERAKEILGTLGARIIGVVVNGTDRRAGSGRYGAYGYGYTSSYVSDKVEEGQEELAGAQAPGSPS